MQQLDRLYFALQAAQGIPALSSTPIAAKLDSVEAALSPRLAALDEFAKRPNATAHSIVEAFIAERSSANVLNPPVAARDNAAAEADGAAEPDASAVYRAIALEQFRNMAASVLKEDHHSRIGRLNAIASGFDGQCVLSVRMLCEGSRPLSLKHAALARLFDLRVHLAEYFNWCLTADKSGAVPSRLAHYSIAGKPGESSSSTVQRAGQTFLSHLLKFELESMDWFGSPGGLLALKAAQDGGEAMAKAPHPDDIYTIPEVVTELGDFIHQLLVALGASKSVDGGYTFADWTKLYVEHLLMAKKLRTRELRLQHLDRCHEYFLLALRHFSQELHSRVYCAQPDLKSLTGPLLTDQDAPVTSIKEWESSHETALDMLHKFRGMFAPDSHASGSSAVDMDDPWALPRRSQRTTGGKRTNSPPNRSRPEDDGRKRPRESPKPSPAAAKIVPSQPGSATWAHMWLAGRAELLISGRVWKIRRLATKLKLKAGQSVCWPVVLSAKVGDNRLSHCEHAGAAGHETTESAAHKIANFRASTMIEDSTLWRYPTEAEKESLRSQRPSSPDQRDNAPPAKRHNEREGRDRGAGRGRPRHDRGGQDFQQPSPPRVEDVTA